MNSPYRQGPLRSTYRTPLNFSDRAQSVVLRNTLRLHGQFDRTGQGLRNAIGRPIAGMKLRVSAIVQFLDRDFIVDPSLYQGETTKEIDALVPGDVRYHRRNLVGQIKLARWLHDRAGVLRIHQHHIDRPAREQIQPDGDRRLHLVWVIILASVDRVGAYLPDDKCRIFVDDVRLKARQFLRRLLPSDPAVENVDHPAVEALPQKRFQPGRIGQDAI